MMKGTTHNAPRASVVPFIAAIHTGRIIPDDAPVVRSSALAGAAIPPLQPDTMKRSRMMGFMGSVRPPARSTGHHANRQPINPVGLIASTLARCNAIVVSQAGTVEGSTGKIDRATMRKHATDQRRASDRQGCVAHPAQTAASIGTTINANTDRATCRQTRRRSTGDLTRLASCHVLSTAAITC